MWTSLHLHAGTDCLKALIIFEGEVTATRLCNPIIAAVDEEHKDAARLFCITYHISPEYMFQAEKTSQFKHNGTRKYCGTGNGPLYPTTKQGQTARFVTHAKCGGIWSTFKGRWCECSLGTFDWTPKPRRQKGEQVQAHRVEQDHHCVNIQALVDFIVECLNAGLGEKISTHLTHAALAHWTLSYFPADPTASFTHNLPACYLKIAPVQLRHAECHKLCTFRYGHPDVLQFPPTECVVGLTREQLNGYIVHTPSKGTRSKSARPHPDPDPNDSPAKRTHQHDDAPASNQGESSGSGVPVPATGKTHNPIQRSLEGYFK
jgi:hypothetical protein